jgi:hypothetical protein
MRDDDELIRPPLQGGLPTIRQTSAASTVSFSGSRATSSPS